ncbi:MAG: hypothetical protein IJS99_03110 [Synergistaceae bacterium]|nr:hypothetical protein [Synergistaceae bacterium]
MNLFKRNFLAFSVVAALLFIAVISGGCGGSSSSSFLPIDITDYDTILTGGWVIDTSAKNTLSADVNGETVNFAIHNVAVKLSSVDVEGSAGSAYIEAFALISDDNVLLPLAYDLTKLSTDMTLTESGQWLAEGQNSLLTITLNNAESSNPTLNIRGIVRFIGDSYAVVNVTLKKFNETAKTESQMNALINGNWQSNISEYNGGFLFTSMDMGSTQETPAPNENVPGMLRIPGMTAIDEAYFSAKLSNSSISQGKATMSQMSLLAFLNDEASRDWSGDGPLMPLIDVDLDVNLSHVFGDIYKLEFPFDDIYKEAFPDLETVSDKTYVILDGGNSGYAVNITALKAGTEYVEIRSVLTLEKKPDSSDVNVTDYIGTAWDSFFAAGQTINFTTATPAINNLMIRSLNLAFPEADITNRKFTALITAEYSEMNPTATPESGTSPDVKVLNAQIDLVNVKQLAYNTWYAVDESGESDFAFTLLDSPVGGDPIALVFANISSGLIGGSYISIAAFVSEAGEMSDVFFKGAWTHRPGDKASVQFVASDRPSTPRNADLINFGAYFSSVDINAGTANFSAVSLLAFDNPLNPGNNVFTPMVYDRVPVNVNSTDTPGIYKVTTENGSSFTVQMLSPDSDGTMRANLSGVIKYESLGFNISIDAEVTKSDNEAATLDFDSVMKDSTWQTTLADSANSGGFVVMPNAQVQYPYIAANPGQTMASLSFKGDSNNAAATGFGIMNTSAGTIPLTLLNLPLSVQHMFNNFYRFDFTSGDQGIKGVCVLSDDKSSKLILEADHKLGTNELKMHVLLSLTKLTSSSEQDIRQWIGTSWTKEHTGGFLVSGDNSLRFSDMTEYNPELILDSFDVTFGQPIGTNTIDFSANITLHRSGSDVILNLPFNGNVDVYDAGVNMWYGIAQANHSQFILTIIKDEMGSGYHVILSANLNVPFNGNYYFVSLAGTMIQK